MLAVAIYFPEVKWMQVSWKIHWNPQKNQLHELRIYSEETNTKFSFINVFTKLVISWLYSMKYRIAHELLFPSNCISPNRSHSQHHVFFIMYYPFDVHECGDISGVWTTYSLYGVHKCHAILTIRINVLKLGYNRSIQANQMTDLISPLFPYTYLYLFLYAWVFCPLDYISTTCR